MALAIAPNDIEAQRPPSPASSPAVSRTSSFHPQTPTCDERCKQVGIKIIHGVNAVSAGSALVCYLMGQETLSFLCVAFSVTLTVISCRSYGNLTATVSRLETTVAEQARNLVELRRIGTQIQQDEQKMEQQTEQAQNTFRQGAEDIAALNQIVQETDTVFREENNRLREGTAAVKQNTENVRHSIEDLKRETIEEQKNVAVERAVAEQLRIENAALTQQVSQIGPVVNQVGLLVQRLQETAPRQEMLTSLADSRARLEALLNKTSREKPKEEEAK